jgi:hypothetical protein
MQCEYLYRFSWFDEESHNGEWYAYILYCPVSWTVSGESYAYIKHCLGPRKQKTHVFTLHSTLTPTPHVMVVRHKDRWRP